MYNSFSTYSFTIPSLHTHRMREREISDPENASLHNTVVKRPCTLDSNELWLNLGITTSCYTYSGKKHCNSLSLLCKIEVLAGFCKDQMPWLCVLNGCYFSLLYPFSLLSISICYVPLPDFTFGV